MQADIGLLKNNVYAKRILRGLKLDYVEFDTPKEMLGSDVPVLFCDEMLDLKETIESGKFVITNHEVLMNTIGKPVIKSKSFYYVMKDFVFGERSFFIDEDVYCCSNSVDTADTITQSFLMEQDVIDVGLTYNASNEAIAGACILVGRQMISLPWKISEFGVFKEIEAQPYYIEKRNIHRTKFGANVNLKAFSHLLLALLRYAYRRQGLWMPQKKKIQTRMGEQEIVFIYPSEQYMKKWRKRYVLHTGNCLRYLFAVMALLAILLNCVFNIRSLPNILPFYHSTLQTRYLPDFTEEMLYADTLLQLLVSDKEVILHDSGDEYEHFIFKSKKEESTEIAYVYEPDRRYYLGRDYYRYFMQFAKTVKLDSTLPVKASVSQLAMSDNMTCIGYSNDMLRHIFMLNEDAKKGVRHTSYFWYDYIYRITSEPMYVFIESDLADDCETLVALWDEQNNLYVMSEQYYEEVIAP